MKKHRLNSTHPKYNKIKKDDSNIERILIAEINKGKTKKGKEKIIFVYAVNSNN